MLMSVWIRHLAKTVNKAAELSVIHIIHLPYALREVKIVSALAIFKFKV